MWDQAREADKSHGVRGVPTSARFLGSLDSQGVLTPAPLHCGNLRELYVL